MHPLPPPSHHFMFLSSFYYSSATCPSLLHSLHLCLLLYTPSYYLPAICLPPCSLHTLCLSVLTPPCLTSLVRTRPSPPKLTICLFPHILASQSAFHLSLLTCVSSTLSLFSVFLPFHPSLSVNIPPLPPYLYVVIFISTQCLFPHIVALQSTFHLSPYMCVVNFISTLSVSSLSSSVRSQHSTFSSLSVCPQLHLYSQSCSSFTPSSPSVPYLTPCSPHSPCFLFPYTPFPPYLFLFTIFLFPHFRPLPCHT